MKEDHIEERKKQLASSVMSVSAGTLLLNMSFLARAVGRLPVFSGGEGLSCDGRRFMYGSDHVLGRYRQSERLPVHDYLHVMLHCIFRHWNVGERLEENAWNAACDIAAEALIMQTASDFCANEHEPEKNAVIKKLSLKIKPLTAEKIYAYFRKNNFSPEEIAELCGVFAVDDHSIWYKNRNREYEEEEKQKVLSIGYPDNEGGKEDKDKDAEENSGSGGSDEKNKSEKDESPQEQNGRSDADENVQQREEQMQSGGAPVNDEEISLDDWLEKNRLEQERQLEEQWRKISEQIQSELESFGKRKGDQSSYLTSALKDVNRDRCDYSAFLKRFAASGEVMRSDIDSFDINFYSYGLSLYGNVALIEPPEYREVKLVKDFVIAIDTSGSVSGSLVKSFVEKTYSILKSRESFFEKVNIYIIQCDTEVREAVKISSFDEFEKFIAQMEIKGLGGTDFRPVFDYVDELLARGEFDELKGLIYFTDGIGEFPERKPPYETAFAFMRSDYDSDDPPDVPAWAIKLILEEDIRYGN